MNEIIQKILELSINAPSGSNSQPWRFRVRGNQIEIFALPEKDHPILNYRNRGTWIAHGALIENILISASAMGYKSRFNIFPEKSEPNLTARINLEKAMPSTEPLFAAIPKRATNRKPYKLAPLAENQKTELLKSVQEINGGAELKLVEDRERIKTLGQAGAVNEIVTLENQLLHKLFFNEIVWTKIEEQQEQKGLYLKTMGLKPPQQAALKVFRHWPVMNFLNKFKIARGIAKGNAKVYSSTPIFGAVIVNDSDEDFITAGRLMERLWLKAGMMGLSFHIITGILFFRQRIKAGMTKEFSEEHVNLVEDAYNRTASAFDVKNGIIALTFRIGDGGEPTARSTKAAPVVEYL